MAIESIYAPAMTMASQLADQQNTRARLNAYLQQRDVALPLEQAQAAAEIPLAGQMAQSKLYGTPFEQSQEAGKQKRAQAQLAMSGANLGVNQGQLALAQQNAKSLNDYRTKELELQNKRYDPITLANRQLMSKGLQLVPDAQGNMVVSQIEGANSNKAVPIPAQNNLTSGSDLLQRMVALRNDFNDYGGYSISGVGQAVNALQYLPFLPTNQRDWWKNYQDLYEATKRHSLYGTGVSGREAGMSAAGSINPGMQNESIAKYMDARIGMMIADMNKSTRSLSQSFNPKQIEEAVGINGIKEAQLSPKSIDDFADIGRAYREVGRVTQPARPRSVADLQKLQPGDPFINPADDKLYIKK